MKSPILIITAIESGTGFLLTSTILYLVLSRGRKAYHYLFAAFLFLCAFWDLGTFLLMIRNEHTAELELIGFIIAMPCSFIPALIFHFSVLYTGRKINWAVILVWGATGIFWILSLLGLYWKIDGVYNYSWGNIFRVVPSPIDPVSTVLWFAANLIACWFLFQGAKKATSRLERRHHLYIASGFLVVNFAILKVGVVMGINVPWLLPLGMFLNDIMVSIIGLAIIKERLFDITLIVKKGTLYSLLAGLLIFVYAFSEHVLITYFGKMVGGNSEAVHLVSIAIGIAVLMPVKKRLETGIEKYFYQKQLVF